MELGAAAHNEQVGTSDSEPPSAVSPLAPSTTLLPESSQVDRTVQCDKPDSGPENDEVRNDSVLPKTDPPATTVAATALDSSQENSNEQVGTGDTEPPSAVSPLAPSTTSPLESSQVDRTVQCDEPDSEAENDEDDDSVLPETAKYKIGTFIIKEFDDISCVGVIHRFVHEQNKFLYSVSFFEVDLEESFDEDEMTKHVFFYDDWIVMKDLDVFVTVGKAEHYAKIDSIVRLTDDSVDTTVLRVRWSNNFKDVVDISSVKPMHSSEHHSRRRTKKSPETKDTKLLPQHALMFRSNWRVQLRM